MNTRKLVFVSGMLLSCFGANASYARSHPERGQIFDTARHALDSTAVKHWVAVGRNDAVSISNDGKYVGYTLSNMPYQHTTLVVQRASDSGRRVQIVDAPAGFFSGDSRQYCFLKGDTLYSIGLELMQMRALCATASYQHCEAIKGEWLGYMTMDSARDVTVRSLTSNVAFELKHVENYAFTEEGNALVYTTGDGDKRLGMSLQRLDLVTGKMFVIWESPSANEKVAGFSADKRGDNIAFSIAPRTGDESKNTIWLYSTQRGALVEKVDENTPGVGTDLNIGSSLRLSSNGQYIYFSLQYPATEKASKDDIRMDVWSTNDSILQSEQLEDRPVAVEEVIAASGSKAVIVQTATDKGMAIEPSGDYFVTKHNTKRERWWLNVPDSIWLVSAKDGTRQLLLITMGYTEFWFSPDNRFLIYFDAGQGGNFFSYNLATGRVVKISAKLAPGLLEYKWFYEGPGHVKQRPRRSYGVAGWLTDRTAVLIYDQYDIWELNLSGDGEPINVTKGFGREHKIILRQIDEDLTGGNWRLYTTSNPVILKAFNVETKEDGFYKLSFSKTADPELLTMGPFTYWHVVGGYMLPGFLNFSESLDPLKAKFENVWIVKRSNEVEAPNYYVTTDFRVYKKLTSVEPQRPYNWLTSELIHFTQEDGIATQGILYKPQDFDSTRQYPLLINIYTQFSHRLHEFPVVGLIEDAHINIPWFVSHGYIVLQPDIYFTEGQRGQSALECVLGAVKYLSGRRYIDTGRIGISGHSFAGGLITYIVTHSSRFTAALEGAGNTDVISSSLELTGNSILGNLDVHQRLEVNEMAMGVSIWERPDLYVKNLNILCADKVTTPLLIFHNKDDPGVRWAQGLELFISLWRLGKTAWMLQYDEAGHNVHNRQAEDLTIRVTEFFDHYLKGLPAARWMTQGVPGRLRGVERRYELDQKGEH